MTLAFDDRYQLVQPVVSTSEFTVDFPVFALQGDIDVYVNGVAEIDFTITGTNSNGRYTDAVLTLNGGGVIGDVEIIGMMSVNRIADIINGPTLVDRINESDDRTVGIIQELKRDVARAPKIPFSSSATTDLTPSAGRYLGWNADGTAITNLNGPTVAGSADFDTNADVIAADIVATAQWIRTAGRDTVGDGGHALYARVGAEPAHDAWIQSNDGAYWEYVPEGNIVNARVLGLMPSNTDAQNGTAVDSISEYMNQDNFMRLLIPPGSYLIDRGFSFDESDYDIEGYGSRLRPTFSSGVVYTLNENAQPDESNIEARVTIRGGSIFHQTSYAGTPNTVTGVDFLGLTRVVIKDVWFQWLHIGIVPDVRDGILIENCNFFQNNNHVKGEDFITTGANPQGVLITSCWASTHYDAGYRFDGDVNMVTISEGYTVGSRAIVAQNKNVNNNNGLTINRMDFEQGANTALTGTWTFSTASAVATGSGGAALTEIAVNQRIQTAGGEVYTVDVVTDDNTITLDRNAEANEAAVAIELVRPYIEILDDNNGDLFCLDIDSCKFSVFNSGGTHVLHARGVTGLNFSGEVAGAAKGWMWLRDDCSRVNIGNVCYSGTTEYAHVDCARTELEVFPKTIDLETYTAGAGVAAVIDNGTPGKSTSNVTVDLTTQLSAIYPKGFHAKGVVMSMHARDSGSAAGTARITVTPSSTVTEGEGYRYGRIDLDGHNDNARVPHGDFYCPIVDGSVYVRYVATGAGTLDSHLTAKRLEN